MNRSITETVPAVMRSTPGADGDGNPTAGIGRRADDSGVVVLWSARADTRSFCEALAGTLEAADFAFGFVWFSPTRHDGREITRRLAALVPGFRYAGCSTSGEITPDGLQEHGIVALLLPRTHFRAAVTVLEEVHTLGMEAIAQRALEAQARFVEGVERAAESVFAISLIDGLAYAEEAVTAALDRGLGGLPLVGGSAGDDLAFRGTVQIAGGEVHSHAALLVLVECALPFRVFTDNNFLPTGHRLVVTESDPDRRIVREFNAEPAAEAYARAIGVDVAALDAFTFASNALVVRVGGEYHCRSIQRLEDDGSLSFFCAIDDGLVLTVARSEGTVRSTRRAVERLEREIGPLAALFGFDCMYRRLDARHRDITERVETLYREKGFVGFNTYGEQFRSMHVNQTLTGVAIGRGKGEARAIAGGVDV